MAHHTQQPIDSSVLTLQERHLSQRVLSGDKTLRHLIFKHWDGTLRDLQVTRNVAQVLDRWGFYGVFKTCKLQLDQHLLTALIERWRPETHSFFLPSGEAAVTLQDVSVIWGLPIDGTPIVSRRRIRTDSEWLGFMRDRLGWTATSHQIKGRCFVLGKLGDYVVEAANAVNMDSTDDEVLRCARAIVALLVCGVLFPDTHGDQGKLMLLDLLADDDEIPQLSWGSAVLAYLYRCLCEGAMGRRSLGGPMRLLMIWAYSRIPSICPERGPIFLNHGYDRTCRMVFGYSYVTTMIRTRVPSHQLLICRDSLDLIRRDGFNWNPYTEFPMEDFSQETQAMWLYTGPMIFFGVVEPHNIDRVRKQLGYSFSIPRPVECRYDSTHKHWKETGQTWEIINCEEVNHWESRFDSLYDPRNDHSSEDEYFTWYHRIAVLILGTSSEASSGWRGGVAQPVLYEAAQLEVLSQNVERDPRSAAVQMTTDSRNLYGYLYGGQPRSYTGAPDFPTDSTYAPSTSGVQVPSFQTPPPSLTQEQMTMMWSFYQSMQQTPTPGVGFAPTYGASSSQQTREHTDIPPIGPRDTSMEPEGEEEEPVTRLRDESPDQAVGERRGRRTRVSRACGTGGHLGNQGNAGRRRR